MRRFTGVRAFLTNGMSLAIAACSLVFVFGGWAAREQGRLHNTLGLHAAPAMYRSRIEGHEQYLQTTAFRSNRLGVIHSSERDQSGREIKKYRCRMPAYDIRWRRSDINVNEHLNAREKIGLRDTPAACGDLRVSNASNPGRSGSERWMDFGEQVAVIPMVSATRRHSGIDYPVELRYSDSTPILPRETLVHIEPRSAGGPALTVRMSFDAKNTCTASYFDGRLSDCGGLPSARNGDVVPIRGPGPIVKGVYLDTDRNDSAADVATIFIDAEGMIRVSGHHLSTAADTDATAEQTQDFDLPCSAGSRREGAVVRRFSVGHKAYGLRVWCENSRPLPTTEAQRLADRASKEARSSTADEALVESALDTRLDAELNRALRERCPHCEVLVMDTFRGSVVAMASGRVAKDKDGMRVTNFERKPQGSVVKPIYATAALESTEGDRGTAVSPLLSLRMSSLQPDYLDPKRGWMSCRVANGAIPGCLRDRKGGYDTHAVGGEYDFYRFMVRSENVYATTLLYLGSSRPLSDADGDCENAFELLPAVPEVDAWQLTIEGRDARDWAAKRVPLFNSRSKLSCLNTGMLPWLSWLREHMNIGRRNEYFRSYLWLDEHRAALRIEGLHSLAPELEHATLFEKEGVWRRQGFIESSVYKSPYGGGDALWTNVGIAEAISTIVSGSDQKASLLAHSLRAEPSASPLGSSRAAVAKAMAGVVGDPEGTANRYFHSMIEACGPSPQACVRTQQYGPIRVLAKTGTPKRSPDGGHAKKRIEARFPVLTGGRSRSALCQPFEGNRSSCRLTAEGDTLFRTVSMAYRYSSTSDNLGKRLDDKALRGAFQRWLSEEILASDSGDGPSEGGSDDQGQESRLVVVLLQPAQNEEAMPKAGCTLVMTSETKNPQALVDILGQLLRGESLLRSCRFLPVQADSTR